MKEFRNLRADEIQIRPTDTKYKGSALLLLYKDARCDMSILDETVGTENWCKKYYEVKGNLYCSVGIKCDNGEWVYKDDCGTESNTDAEKGEASDAFKRACVNWGIGRELYTTPKVRIKCPDNYYTNNTDKLNMTFRVLDIGYNGKTINKLVIVDRNGNIVYDLNGKQTYQQQVAQPQQVQQTNCDDGRIPSWLYGKTVNAPTMEELKETWNNNKQYHNSQIFKNLVNKRKAALSAV